MFMKGVDEANGWLEYEVINKIEKADLMIEIFLEAPIELQTLILGGVTALIVVLVKGNGERDDFEVDLIKIRNGGKNEN